MKKLILAAFIGLSTLNGYSQIDIGDLLQAGAHDANVLAHPYMQTYGELLGTSLNSGWYTSAKPHKVLGFDITITGAYTKAPSSATSYDVANYESKLESFELVDPSNSIAPTIAGDAKNRPELRVKGDMTNLSAFEMPNGTGMDYFLTPMVTAGVGLPYGIEIKGRFAPKLELGDAGKFGLWGLGVQKDVKDYIPGVKHVPVLNISVLAAYTDFTSSVGVSALDPNLGDQEMEVSASAYTTRLLVGANLPVIAFYSGFGYGHSSSDFNVLGDFGTDPITGEQMVDPIKLAYTTSGFDFNVGMRLRLGIIGIHADYTVGEYSSITAGLGINFR
ncbi:hypothetical protein E9993_13445 [Labilibacter sediminis]|nr:hypothetical protein E9993_13445 [Labilibacter sediminis]